MRADQVELWSTIIIDDTRMRVVGIDPAGDGVRFLCVPSADPSAGGRVITFAGSDRVRLAS